MLVDFDRAHSSSIILLLHATSLDIITVAFPRYRRYVYFPVGDIRFGFNVGMATGSVSSFQFKVVRAIEFPRYRLLHPEREHSFPVGVKI